MVSPEALRPIRGRVARLACLALACVLPVVCGCAVGTPARSGDGAVVGRVVPKATFSLADGAELPLESTRGSVVLLAFFTSYCPTSPGILRAVDGLRSRDAARGLTVLAVNEGDDPAHVDELATRLGVRVAFAFDKAGGAAKDMGLVTVPSVVLVDRQGIVRHVHAGYHGEDDRAAIDHEVTSLLGE